MELSAAWGSNLAKPDTWPPFPSPLDPPEVPNGFWLRGPPALKKSFKVPRPPKNILKLFLKVSMDLKLFLKVFEGVEFLRKTRFSPRRFFIGF